ncbi:MAG: globin family protein [Fibrobacteria bacterium]
MTPTQIQLVQSTWNQVLPIADTAATLFYGRLFELDPTLRPLFKPDLASQKKNLMQTLAFAVGGLNNPEALLPAVKQLGKRHAGYHVKDEHYDTVAAALLWTLEQGLGAAFTPEVKAAWTAVYVTLADTMKQAAKEA